VHIARKHFSLIFPATFLLIAAMVFCTLAALPGRAAAAVPKAAVAAASIRPIVFVHGFFGSGSQFETQAKRFASNGYPASYIEANDYDSLFFNNSREQVYAALDARIARLKAATGATQIDLVGHSLGTSISQEYLRSSAARAANVAHYANLDGATATSLPGGVPTVAVWGQNRGSSSITGATNVSLPNQAHVELTASVETFTAMYRLFTGENPATTDIVAQPGTIQLAGRVLNFPSNTTPANASLAVYPVNPTTGARTGGAIATVQVSGDGSFGPINASGTARYEFAVTKGGVTHHHYFEPFRRTDRIVRILTNDPGTGADVLFERGANHTALLAYRNKEWWTDQGDTLTVNGTNVTTSPRSRGAIGVFAFDAGQDRRSNPGTAPGLLSVLPFISGTDVYVASSPTAAGTVVVESRQRGGAQTHRFGFPNFQSSNNMVTLNFDDFPQP
jgi:pimeloyl-ACP methyl ester carboxylesterase